MQRTLARFVVPSRLSSSKINFHETASKWTNPIKYLQWKVKRIDHAREAYEICSTKFEKDTGFVSTMSLPEDFKSWFAVTVMHIWMLNARLRTEGPDGKEMRQELFEHLWLDVELKLAEAGVKHNFSKIVEGLLTSYYGQTLAYDEGLYMGDATLASALWRNVYGSNDQIDIHRLALMVKYIRSQLNKLETITKDEVLAAKIEYDEVEKIVN